MPDDGSFLSHAKPLRAVVVARDVAGFELLADAMELELGAAWTDMDPASAHPFLRADAARALRFVVVAADAEDETDPNAVRDVIRHASSVGLKVILVSSGLSRAAEDDLAENGVDGRLPYPFKGTALRETIRRVEASPKAGAPRAGAAGVAGGTDGRRAGDHAAERRHGAIYAVQSAAGGDGATTFAVNLAWELATVSREDAPRVCLIDLDLQFGSAATYLDLPQKPVIFEILSDISAMDEQAFRQALTPFKDRLNVFTAPADILPFDLVGPDEIGGLLRLARTCFDVVVVDMPRAITGWTETVFGLSDRYFVTCGLEVRSAQNALRFQKLLQLEGMATERLAFVLNRAPGRLDPGGRGRVDRMATSLGVAFHAVLPDGGRPVTDVNDQAGTLGLAAPKNALTRAIRDVAGGLHQARVAQAAGTGRKAGATRSFLGLRLG